MVRTSECCPICNKLPNTHKMAEEALDYVRDLAEGQIVRSTPSPPSVCLGSMLTGVQDFEGQRLNELIYTVLLSAVGVRVQASHICSTSSLT
jgi:hypothetical protein